MILDAKFSNHQLLNRQSEMYAREGIDLDVSTLADWVGACSATLSPLVALIRDHVLAAERIHGDDTRVPVLTKGKTITGRLWTYVRDDRPFGGTAPPAAIFYFSRDRRGEHPKHLAGYCGILQADAGFGDLYREARKPIALPRLCAGHTVEATSSNWPNSQKRRSRLRRCDGPMLSLISSTRLSVCRMNSDAQRARIKSLL
jgi:hypothetical protein